MRPDRAAATLAERERAAEAERARQQVQQERVRIAHELLAQTLHVSLPTANTHVSRILTKLGARDRTQLVVLAYESGLTSA